MPNELTFKTTSHFTAVESLPHSQLEVASKLRATAPLPPRDPVTAVLVQLFAAKTTLKLWTTVTPSLPAPSLLGSSVLCLLLVVLWGGWAFGYTKALGHDRPDSSHFGLTLHLMHAIPLNKKLYTSSYVCLTSGAALVFSAIYPLLMWQLPSTAANFLEQSPEQVDIWDLKYMFLPLERFGMNTMLVYVMVAEGIFAGFSGGWYDDDPHNALVYGIQKYVSIKVWLSRRVDRHSTLCYLGKDLVLRYYNRQFAPALDLFGSLDGCT
ncbi:hypothetical protein Q3G72_028992 [Acer saccharum]|nr:hypothetical protein Q3G72_028992 [Acer saccharum]